jgi:hypothetical protein
MPNFLNRRDATKAEIDALPTMRQSPLEKALDRLGAGVANRTAKRLAKYRAAYADHDDKETEERKHG